MKTSASPNTGCTMIGLNSRSEDAKFICFISVESDGVSVNTVLHFAPHRELTASVLARATG
jgi:hypothetical protein